MSLVLWAAPVSFAADEEANIVDMRGTRTYIGSSSAWSSPWDPNNFEDITNQELVYNSTAPLTIRSGRLDRVVATDSDVTVENLIADEIQAEGDITIADSTVDQLISNGDVRVESGTYDDISSEGTVELREGTVKGDVTASSLNLNSANGVTVRGEVNVNNMTLPSGRDYSISRTIHVSESLTVDGSVSPLNRLDGQGEAAVIFQDYHGTVPYLQDFDSMTLEDSDVSLRSALDLTSIDIDEGSSLTTTGNLQVDFLTGNGDLTVGVGRLTVERSLEGDLDMYFTGNVQEGATAFRVGAGGVSLSSLNVFDYTLRLEHSGMYDNVVFDELLRDGVTLSPSAITLDANESRDISVSLRPGLGSFASSTRLEWEVVGGSDVFSVTGDINGGTVSFRPKEDGTYTATVRAYLTDGRTRLEEFRSGTVQVTGIANQNSNAGSSSGSTLPFTLDTSYVTIKQGNSYFILALTNDKTAPGAYVEGDTSVVQVGAPTAYSYNGRIGWLYEIKALKGGSVNVVFSNASTRLSCAVTVEPISQAITLDTSSVVIPVGNSYRVLAITELKTPPVCSSSNNTVAQVESPTAYNYNGRVGWLYKVNGNASGTADIVIGDKVMKTTVARGTARVDTKEYTMKPGDVYYIGVALSGVSKSDLTVTHQNNCTQVYDAGSSNGIQLYRVVGSSVGDDAVIFRLGNQTLQVPIHVRSGVSPSGVSGGGMLYL